jgi:hypothetical protein
MDAPAFEYLFRLAALSMAFVGFASIVVALRRGLGGELSPFHVLLVHIFVETGLIVTVGALLPPLLNLLAIPVWPIWQTSSIIGGILAPILLIAYIRRVVRVDRSATPARFYTRYPLSAIAVVLLWMNALGIGFQPSGGPYAVALTLFLVVAGLGFVQTLDEVLYGPGKRKR